MKVKLYVIAIVYRCGYSTVQTDYLCSLEYVHCCYDCELSLIVWLLSSKDNSQFVFSSSSLSDEYIIMGIYSMCSPIYNVWTSHCFDSLPKGNMSIATVSGSMGMPTLV